MKMHVTNAEPETRYHRIMQAAAWLVIGMAGGMLLAQSNCLESMRRRYAHIDVSPAINTQLSDGWMCPPSTSPMSSVDFLLDLHQVPLQVFDYWQNIDSTRSKLKELSGDVHLNLLHISQSQSTAEDGTFSGFWLFQEGRLDIQAWKSHKFISINWHTCQPKSGAMLRALKAMFRPRHMTLSRVTRGDGNPHVLYRMKTDTVSNAAVIPSEKEEASLVGKSVDICVNGNNPSDDCLLMKHLQIMDRKDSINGVIEVVRTKNFGFCILQNRLIEFCEADLPAYAQEMIMPVMLPYEMQMQEFLAGDHSLSTSSQLRIQLIDNGDGWINAYLLERYGPLIGSIDILAHNPDMTALAKKHLKSLNQVQAFTDRRLNWSYGTLQQYSEKCSSDDESVDIFILNEVEELTDKTVRSTFNRDFYEFVSRKLKVGGRIVQRLGPLRRKDQIVFLKKFEQIWRDAGLRVLKQNTLHLTGQVEPSMVWIGQKH